MLEIIAGEFVERGVEVPKPKEQMPLYTAVAVVGPGQVMNVDCHGDIGVLAVTVPAHCQKGDSFQFTLPAELASSAPQPTHTVSSCHDTASIWVAFLSRWQQKVSSVDR